MAARIAELESKLEKALGERDLLRGELFEQKDRRVAPARRAY
jgi:hypothetical protein